MSRLKLYCCALFFLVFGITSSSGQQLSIGSNVFLNSTTFDFDGGKSGTNSPNTIYAGGAGGGGSLFISYEDGSIQKPIILNSGGSALSVYTTTPLTNGANGRVLYYQR